MMDRILKSAGLKDAIGVFFVVITGLLYAIGVTEAATEVARDVELDDTSFGAAVEGPQDGSGAPRI